MSRRAAAFVLSVIVPASALAAGGAASARSGAQTRPPRVVASIGSTVVVLSGTDGHLVRTIAEAPARVMSVTPTPDGATVYYAVGEQCGSLHEIWRVPTSGGQPKRVTSDGASPLVSPNGRLLAYATASPIRVNGCAEYGTLVVRDVPHGAEHRLGLGDRQAAIGPSVWRPDSRGLVVARGPSMVTVSLDERGLHARGLIMMPGNGYQFLPSGEAVTSFPHVSTTEIATFDPKTGKKKRTLASVASQLFFGGFDASGRSFLLSGPLAESSSGWVLYRGEVGASEPVELAAGVQSATWLPESRQ